MPAAFFHRIGIGWKFIVQRPIVEQARERGNEVPAAPAVAIAPAADADVPEARKFKVDRGVKVILTRALCVFVFCVV